MLCECGCGKKPKLYSSKYVWGHTNFGKKLSGETKKKISIARRGIGRKKHVEGYILVYLPDHPFAYSDGYMLEHRLVMEKHIGRYLKAYEVVHHINCKKDDNRIENLQLLTISDHLIIHKTIDMSNYQCCVCGSKKTIIRPSGRPQWPYLNGLPICNRCYQKNRRGILRKD
jgi:hypothetical protein